MVYIYKKSLGYKNYYYLRASERKGKRVVSKDIAYLGDNILDVKKALDSLTHNKEDIRRAYKTIHRSLESNYYLEKVRDSKLKKDSFLEDKQPEIEACRLHYNSVFLKNDEQTKKEILGNFIIEFAYNTASIEGNTISLLEARNLIEEGKTPQNKTLREIYDLQNQERVFFSLLGSKEDLSHEFIINMHSELMKNIDKRVGSYRTTDIRVVKSHFDATPGPYVKTDMNLLLKWYEQNKSIYHPLVLSVVFQHKFEKIHPFMDGNGRTGRMLINYILMRNKYPPVIIHNKARHMYLEALGRADESDLKSVALPDYAQLIQFVSDELIGSYWNIFL